MNAISTLALVWGKAWPILAAILFFGLLIATHEGGHFLTAKLFKVRVNEFSLGMGPVLWKKQKAETQYSVRALPIGGYVAMEGEDGDSEVEGAFNSKPPWQRAIIILAGATVNLITGLLIIAAMLGTSDLIGTPAISQFRENASSPSTTTSSTRSMTSVSTCPRTRTGSWTSSWSGTGRRSP